MNFIKNSKKLFGLFAFGLAFMATGCDSDSGNNPTPPKPEYETTYSIDVTPSSTEISNLGGGILIKVKAIKIEKEKGNASAVAKETPVNFTYEPAKNSAFTFTVVDGGLEVSAPFNGSGKDISESVRIYIANTDASQTVTLTQKIGVTEIDGFPIAHPFIRMAEYFVGSTPGMFADNHDYEKQTFYTLADAIKACPKGYRLPTYNDVKDFVDAFGLEAENRRRIDFLEKEYVTFIGGEGENRAAYKYSAEESKTKKVMVLEAVYLGNDNASVTEETIGDEAWWTADGRKVARRVLPLSAFDGALASGSNVFIWTATPHPTKKGSNLTIMAKTSKIYMSEKPGNSNKLVVWPIRDN